MTLRTVNPARVLAAAGAALGLLCLVLVLIATTGNPSRATLLGSIERPAVLPASNVGPHRVAATVPAGAYKLRLMITPNRAGAHNTVAIALTRHGIPVTGATASVTYSMPAMNMQNALHSVLRPRGGAGYALREPVLGMPGSWAMRFHVRPPGGAPFAVTVNDLLR